MFRECVLVMQNMVSNSPGAGKLGQPDRRPGRGYGAVNYRTENFCGAPGHLRANDVQPDIGFAKVFSNSLLFRTPSKPPPDLSNWVPRDADL